MIFKFNRWMIIHMQERERKKVPLGRVKTYALHLRTFYLQTFSAFPLFAEIFSGKNYTAVNFFWPKYECRFFDLSRFSMSRQISHVTNELASI